MSVESLQHEELVQLLELLCEDRLDRDQAARLEAIVLGDEDARRMYLEYLSLHGTLYWDAARGIDDEFEVVEVGVAATGPIDRSPAAGRRPLATVAVWASAAALLLAACGGGGSTTPTPSEDGVLRIEAYDRQDYDAAAYEAANPTLFRRPNVDLSAARPVSEALITPGVSI